nr:sulfurtransferase-like selenium metabolism protein YedF [Veillonella sp. CHU110]
MESPEVKMSTPVMPAQGVGDKVLLLTKDYLGEGSEELGHNLMKSFLYVLTEADVKPKAIYCINSAVNMLVTGSDHLDNLTALEAAGVTIAGCGICLDFYGVKDKVQVGTITNLYAITESLLQEQVVTL